MLKLKYGSITLNTGFVPALAAHRLVNFEESKFEIDSPVLKIP
jgi:hypothetical protein